MRPLARAVSEAATASRTPGQGQWGRMLAGALVLGLGVQHSGSCAGTAFEAPAVQCQLQSTSLHFGTLGMLHAAEVPGQGQVLVACQNPSQTIQRVDVAVGLMASGPGTVTLQSGRGQMRVDLFLDAQGTVPWGSGWDGAQALQASVTLGPGQYQVLPLSIYARLQLRRDAPAGAYAVHIPLLLSVLPRP